MQAHISRFKLYSGGGVETPTKYLPRGACDLEEEIGNPPTCDLEDESRNLEGENTSDLEDGIGGRNHLGPGGRNCAQFGLRTWRTKLEEEIT